MKIAISGGLGFIGSRLATKYAENGWDVRILDNLHPQIHRDERALGQARSFAEVQIGDVRDRGAWEAILAGVDVVLHMAAETGTGQSMDEAARYADVNVTGTAVLSDLLPRYPAIRQVFLPSSRAVYGEGAYRCGEHGYVVPARRKKAAMLSGDFSLYCPTCAEPLRPAPTSEDQEFRPSSVYAATKVAQEHILSRMCEAHDVDLRIARYQNVYGPGQSLGNPYTGVLVIFAQQIREGKRLNIYEDGGIVRDFVYVDDVVEATAALMAHSHNPGPVNIGTGSASSMLDVVDAFARGLHAPVAYDITGDFRFGDIRYAVADTARLRDLGVQMKVDLTEGVHRLLAWLDREADAAS